MNQNQNQTKTKTNQTAKRQIVLDTETTGMRPEDGHRIIEIGAVELIDRLLTGRHYHIYLNPERLVDEAAFKVHGISDDFLADKPVFAEVVSDFLTFIDDAELIAHNAPFDMNFINHELKWLNNGYDIINKYCHSITDSLALAKTRFPGQRNNLDILCKRFQVNNSDRTLHGALLDAELLAMVYLAMTSSQGSIFDQLDAKTNNLNKNNPSEILHEQNNLKSVKNKADIKHNATTVIMANNHELAEHADYLTKLDTENKHCVWLMD